MNRLKSKQAGQAIPEYVLILAGIAILVAGALSVMGKQLSTGFAQFDIPKTSIVAKTPLGSTFTDISSGFIRLIKDFYNKNGRWPRSWGDFAYTDLGLNPADWTGSLDGIIYRPVGNRINIRPAPGYTFRVTDITGKVWSLPSSYNWNLVYNMQTGQWHYKDLNGAVLQIKTLEVVPPKPK